MSKFETYSLAVNVLLAFAALVTLFVYFRQLKLMYVQLIAAQDASKAQSALALVQHLQSADVRKARELVRGVLSNKPLAEWTPEERSAAALVVSNYDVAAALLKAGVAPLDIIADNWGPSIVHCHEVLAAYTAECRSRPGGCASYWENFDWLAHQAKKRTIGLL